MPRSRWVGPGTAPRRPDRARAGRILAADRPSSRRRLGRHRRGAGNHGGQRPGAGPALRMEIAPDRPQSRPARRRPLAQLLGGGNEDVQGVDRPRGGGRGTLARRGLDADQEGRGNLRNARPIPPRRACNSPITRATFPIGTRWARRSTRSAARMARSRASSTAPAMRNRPALNRRTAGCWSAPWPQKWTARWR